MSWSAKFDRPIDLGKGKRLTSLSEAREYILKLPKAKQSDPRWEAAAGALLLAAKTKNSPTMLAEIGMRRAIAGPDPSEGLPRPGAKATHWSRGKLRAE